MFYKKNITEADLIELNINPKLLLSGKYEALRLPKDFSPDRIVPDFAFNILNKFGLNYRPILDEINFKNEANKFKWPFNKKFAACLTHDVDDVTLFSYKQILRGRVNSLKSSHSFKNYLQNIGGMTFDIFNLFKIGNKIDPLHCYEKWLNIENSVNARSTFFFWPGLKSIKKNHFSDCTYELEDTLIFDGQKCTVAEMICEIDSRGWEIGLHPSWFSYNDLDEMKRQKDALENALKKDVLSVRQHQLHFDIRITPKIHSEAGLKYDSTLGFNDNLGFRNGTSYPWYLTNIEDDTKLDLIEIPLIIQDGAMLSKIKGMRLDVDTSFEYIKQLIDAVENVGGVVTLLWHPNVINEDEWLELYLKSINYLHEKDAWFAPVKEIGSYYKNYQF